MRVSYRNSARFYDDFHEIFGDSRGNLTEGLRAYQRRLSYEFEGILTGGSCGSAHKMNSGKDA